MTYSLQTYVEISQYCNTIHDQADLIHKIIVQHDSVIYKKSTPEKIHIP